MRNTQSQATAPQATGTWGQGHVGISGHRIRTRSRTSEANQGQHSSGMAGQGHRYGNEVHGWAGKGRAVAEVETSILQH